MKTRSDRMDSKYIWNKDEEKLLTVCNGCGAIGEIHCTPEQYEEVKKGSTALNKILLTGLCEECVKKIKEKKANVKPITE